MSRFWFVAVGKKQSRGNVDGKHFMCFSPEKNCRVQMQIDTD